MVDRTPSPRGQYANGLARRAEILQSASQYFAKQGFEAGTIKDIAAECGISRAGLLHHFPTKESLLEAVLEKRDREDRAWFIPYVRDYGAIGVLRGMVDLAAHNRSVPGLIELFTRLAAEATNPTHPAHDYFRDRYARLRSSTSSTIAATQAAGAVHADLDPDRAAMQLTALMDGLQIQWLLDRSLDMGGQVDALLREWMSEKGQRRYDAAAEHARV